MVAPLVQAQRHVDQPRGRVKCVPFRPGARLAELEPPSGDPGRLPWLSLEALPYLAPEQTGRMNRPVDPRADLYGLSVTLYPT